MSLLSFALVFLSERSEVFIPRKQLQILSGILEQVRSSRRVQGCQGTLPFIALRPKGWQAGYILILDKGIFVDSFNHIFEEDFGSQGVSMVDNWFPVRPVPAVNCRTETMTPIRAGTPGPPPVGHHKTLKFPSAAQPAVSPKQGTGSFPPCISLLTVLNILPEGPSWPCPHAGTRGLFPVFEKAPSKETLLTSAEGFLTGREIKKQRIAFIVLLLNLKSSQPSCSHHKPSQDLVIPSPPWILPNFILVYHHISMKCFTPLKHIHNPTWADHICLLKNCENTSMVRTLKMIMKQAISQKGSTSIRRDCTKRLPCHSRVCHHFTEYFPEQKYPLSS